MIIIWYKDSKNTLWTDHTHKTKTYHKPVQKIKGRAK